MRNTVFGRMGQAKKYFLYIGNTRNVGTKLKVLSQFPQCSVHTGLPDLNNSPQFEHPNTGKTSFWRFAAVGSVTLGLAVGIGLITSPVEAATPKSKKSELPNAGTKLPTFSKEEVAKHHNLESGIWVTYKNGVYNVTEFAPKHPGADRLLMAAGSSLEPFWELYPIHKTPHVLKILEDYRIGNLKESDVHEVGKVSNEADAFVDDPERNPALIIRSSKPFNGETNPRSLAGSYYTPNELFFVRNHLPVPKVDAHNYTLEIEGLNMTNKVLTLEDIKSLPTVEISSTIQCAGNRRSDMNKFKPVTGLQWTGGAIGNAKWKGARLLDVLRLAGFSLEKYEDPSKCYLQFDGLDSDPSGESYGASIPLSYLLDGNFQPILAYEMNGETLPSDHGYPLRVILPGIAGARNVKWLARIAISSEENQSPWQQRDYKVFNSSVTLNNVDYSSSPPIMDLPVNSYICSHEDGAEIECGHSNFLGYAYSGGGRGIVRVEISTDKGSTWTVVDNLITDKSSTSKGSWAVWEKDIEFHKPGEVEIWVKAVDSAYNQQVETFAGIWNFRGLLSTAYQRIKCTIK